MWEIEGVFDLYLFFVMEIDLDLIDRVLKCVLVFEGFFVVVFEGFFVIVFEGEGLVYVKWERVEVENRLGV